MNILKLVSNMNIEDRVASKQWWSSKRLKYNTGLYLACFIAFLLSCVFDGIMAPPSEGFNEIDMISIWFVLLVMMCVANCFYSAAWIIDTTFNKNNSQLFRERLFSLGYWFSFALPILPILYSMVLFLVS
jgi:hypothetical protein